MQRSIALLAAAATVSMGIFSGCIPDFVRNNGSESGLDKLWAVDIGQEGYDRTGASRLVDRTNADVRMTINIQPEEYKQGVFPDMKTVNALGREYRIGDSEICWDGVDDSGNPIGGTQYSRRICWEQNGCTYQIFAEAAREEVSLDIVSTETAARLEKEPLSDFDGYKITADLWWMEFKSEKIIVNITLYPPQFNGSAAQDLLKDVNLEYVNGDGVDFYRYKKPGLPDDPNVASILWMTDRGLLCMSASVPWTYRKDVPEDALDFINIELAKSITEQMGGRIVPFEEPVK